MWWKSIDTLTPAGTTHNDVTHPGLGLVVWIAIIVGAVFTLLLILDAIMVWDRNKRRLTTGPNRSRFVRIKKFFAWLFYPSFQAYFRSED